MVSGMTSGRLDRAARRNRGRAEHQRVASRLGALLGRPASTLEWLSLEQTDELLARFAEHSHFVVEDDRDLPSEGAWRELWVDDLPAALARFSAAVEALPGQRFVLLHDAADICGGVVVSRDEVVADPSRFVAMGDADVRLIAVDGSAGVAVNADTASGHAEQTWGVASWAL
jgi:hypothetical protein